MLAGIAVVGSPSVSGLVPEWRFSPPIFRRHASPYGTIRTKTRPLPPLKNVSRLFPFAPTSPSSRRCLARSLTDRKAWTCGANPLLSSPPSLSSTGPRTREWRFGPAASLDRHVLRSKGGPDRSGSSMASFWDPAPPSFGSEPAPTPFPRRGGSLSGRLPG